MSFCLNLISNESDYIYQNNQASDFFVELNDHLYLEGDWEVALVELSYCGQRYSNLKREDGMITAKLTARAKLGHIVLSYMQCHEIYIKVEGVLREEFSGTKNLSYSELGFIRITDAHYTFVELKIELAKAAERYTIKQENKKLSVKIKFVTYRMHFEVTDNRHSSFRFLFSNALKNLFQIRYSEILVAANGTDYCLVQEPKSLDYCKGINKDHKICKMRELVLITPYSIGEHYFIINGIKVIIPSNNFWNWYLFSEYCNTELNKIAIADISFDISVDEYELRVYNIEQKHVIIFEFSESLQHILGVPSVLNYSSSMIKFTKLNPKLQIEEEKQDCITESDYLPLILYDDLKVLINDLNTLVKQLNINIKDKRGLEPDTISCSTFTILADNKIEFKNGEDEINLSKTLIELLDLKADNEWLTTSQTSSKPVVLEEYIPPFFYLHVDCTNTFGANNYLRLINNTARNGEYVHIAFNNLNYYSVSKQIINNLHIIITDSRGEDLHLRNPINLILHFRKCLSM